MTGFKYLIGDARKIERLYERHELPPADLVITSPPYYDMKNYDNVAGQVGINQTYEEFLSDIAEILQGCYEVTKPSATLWIVADTFRKKGRLYTFPFDLSRILVSQFEQKTWKLKDIVIWDKGKNIPWHSKGRLKNKFEYLLFFVKNESYVYKIDQIRDAGGVKNWWLSYPERYNGKGTPPSNIWQYTIPIRGWGNGYQQHLCPFPFPLIERIIALSSNKGDIILDPFAGSGTVLAMASVMGRGAIGFDVNKEYKKRFLKEVIPGADLYWDRKQKELQKAKSSRSKFRSTNLRLRKIKASVLISKALDESGCERRAVIALDVLPRQNSLSIYIIADNGNKAGIAINGLDDYISDLNRQFKIRIQFRIMSLKQFIKVNPHLCKLYSYTADQIYKYRRLTNLDSIGNGHSADSCIFSDIRLSINKQKPLH